MASSFFKPVAGMAVLSAGLLAFTSDGDILGVLGLFAVMFAVLLLVFYAYAFRVRRTGAIVFDGEGLKGPTHAVAWSDVTRVELGDFGHAEEPMRFLLLALAHPEHASRGNMVERMAQEHHGWPDVAVFVTDYSAPPEQMLGQATRFAHESRARRGPDAPATGSGA